MWRHRQLNFTYQPQFGSKETHIFENVLQPSSRLQYKTQISLKIRQTSGTRTGLGKVFLIQFLGKVFLVPNGLGKVLKLGLKCLGRIVTFLNCFTVVVLASHWTHIFLVYLSLNAIVCLEQNCGWKMLEQSWFFTSSTKWRHFSSSEIWSLMSEKRYSFVK